MDIAIIGWVWIGIIIGVIGGIMLVSILSSGKQADLETENMHLRFVRDSLKEEIFRLENRSKPKPRNKRNVKAKSLKVG